jgi:hypothetical protein
MRITVDIDGPLWKALSVFYQLKSVCRKVELYKTRKGFHVIGYGAPVKNEEEVLQVRRYFGDDNLRIEIDEINLKSGKPFQVLWNIKNGFENKLIEVWSNGYLE